MSLFLLSLYLLNFVSPAVFAGFIVAVAGRVLMHRRGVRTLSLPAQTLLNTAVGIIVLTLGLILGGSDGKMLTWMALALATAASQWLGMRGWRT